MTLCCFALLLCVSVFIWQIKRSKANRGPAGSVATILNEHIWGNTDVCDCSAWFLFPVANRGWTAFTQPFMCHLTKKSRPDPVNTTSRTAGCLATRVIRHEKPRRRSFLCPHILLPAAAPARAVIRSGDSPVEYLRCLCLPNVHR